MTPTPAKAEGAASQPATIARMLAEHDALRAKIIDLTDAVRDAESVLHHLPDGAYVHVFPDHLHGQVVIYVTAKDLAADVVPAIRDLRRLGHQGVDHRDQPEHGIRSYDVGDSISLHVTLPGGEGATCQRVEVGKKEVPVYEIRCAGAREVTP